MRWALVVEDDSAMRQRLADLLKTFKDLEIDCAANELDARRFIAEREYQIALVDIELGPDRHDKYKGLCIAHDLANKGCIALVVSGTGDDSIRGAAVTLNGGYDFVSKPINDQDFLNRVQHALECADLKKKDVAVTTDWPEGLRVDPNNPYAMFWQGRRVNLTMTEVTMVRCLAMAKGNVVSKHKLSEAMKSGNSRSALPNHIMNVRAKFRDSGDPEFDKIGNAPGQGYFWKI